MDFAQGVDQIGEPAFAAGLGEVGGQVPLHRRGVRQTPSEAIRYKTCRGLRWRERPPAPTASTTTRPW